MKTYWKIFIVLSAFFILISNCRKSEELSLVQTEKLIKIGESSVNVLMKNLKKHLLEALEVNDLVSAFEFCAVQALILTDDVRADLPEGVELKRTSSKYRNPKNAPDELEQKALLYFEKEYSETGKLPANFIQRAAPDEWRYYKPMKINKLCLKCHGLQAQLETNVLSSLEENYPDDKATGYKVDEFRGVVRATIPMTLINN